MKKQMLTMALSSSALLACMAGTAWADSFSAAASYDLGGLTDAAANGTAFVNSGPDTPFGNIGPQAAEGWGEGAAGARSDATGAAAFSGVQADFYELYSAGDAFADSSATWVMEFEADFTGNYSWETFVPGATLFACFGPGGACIENGEPNGAAAGPTLLVDGGEGHAQLSGSLQELEKGATNSFGATLTSLSGLYPPSGAMPAADSTSFFPWGSMASWDPFSFTTDLGHFTAGDTITISYMLTTHAHLPGMPNMSGLAYALLGDPGQLGGPSDFISGELTGVPDPSTTPIPEPGTMLLLGTGLAGLAGMRRRKKRPE